MEVAFLSIISLVFIGGLCLIFIGSKSILKTTRFYKSSLNYKGVIKGYNQDKYSAFLFSPIIEYELINGEKFEHHDFIFSTQKKFRQGKIVDIIVQKNDPYKITLASNKLFAPGAIIFTFGITVFISSIISFIYIHQEFSI